MLSGAALKSAKKSMQSAAAATANAGFIAIVQTIEYVLDLIVKDPNAVAVLQSIEAWLNALLGISTTPPATALAAMHASAAGGGILIQMLVKMIESLLGGLIGNQTVLQAILAFIQKLLGGITPTPAPTP